MPEQFFYPRFQKINQQGTLTQGKNNFIDHRLLWRVSCTDVDRALTLNESILHKLFIIIIINHQVKKVKNKRKT